MNGQFNEIFKKKRIQLLCNIKDQFNFLSFINCVPAFR